VDSDPKASRWRRLRPPGSWPLALIALVWASLLVLGARALELPRLTLGLLAAAGWLGGLAWGRLRLRLAPRLPGLARQLLDRLGDADLFVRWRWIGLLTFYLLIRGPLLLGASYGSDPDAWRVARAGMRLWRDHHYEASRFPGYPLLEIGLAPVIGLVGPVATRLVVALLGFLGILAFDRLGRRLGARSMGLATLALVVAPTHVREASSALEAAPALAALLGTLLIVQRQRPFWAGAALGATAGLQPLAPALLLPLLPWARGAGWTWRQLGMLALTTAEAAAVVFIPVFAVYQADFLDVANPELDLWGTTLGALGLLPTLALGIGLGEGLSRWPGPAPHASRSLILGLLGVSTLLCALPPFEAGRVLPALAMTLLLLAALDLRLGMVAFILGSLLSLALPQDPGGLPAERAARQYQLDGYAELRGPQIPEHAVVLLGVAMYTVTEVQGQDLVPGEDAWALARRDPERDVLYVARLPEALFKRAKREGRPVLVWSPFIDQWTKGSLGYSPLALGARLVRGETGGAAGEAGAWRIGPKAAEKQAEIADDRLTLHGWSGGALRACAEPASPADQAHRVIGRARLREVGASGGQLKLTVTWEDAAGTRLSNTTLLSLDTAGEPVSIRQRLEPPAGAAKARLCARLDGDGSTAVLEKMHLLP